MAIEATPPRASVHPTRSALPALRGGGTAGNARLTAATGVVLLVLLAIIGATLLRMSQLLSMHLFVGLVLIGPVLLKMGSTAYRFAQYYTGDPLYRRKGPPALMLRMIAPMVIATTLVVLASGVALLVIGPSSRDALLPIHKVSFIAWAAFTGVHVLGHLAELPRLLREDYGARASLGAAGLASADPAGRAGRVLAFTGALVAGVVLAILFLPDFGAWLHSAGVLHDG